VSESTDVWTQVTVSLRSQLAESVWFSTFQDVVPLESDSDTLRLMAPFYRVFANTLGNGPWFDTYIQNMPPVPQVG